MKYVAIMFGSEGCDYSIGCGIRVHTFTAAGDPGARESLLQYLEEDSPTELEPPHDMRDGYRIDRIKLFRVDGQVEFDLAAIRREACDAAAKEKREAQEAAERAEFERLKAKFESL